jgi:hypothetical protein
VADPLFLVDPTSLVEEAAVYKAQLTSVDHHSERVVEEQDMRRGSLLHNSVGFR